jgi:hypothetical protein
LHHRLHLEIPTGPATCQDTPVFGNKDDRTGSRARTLARVTASEAGLAVDLRHEGLGAIAALMAPAKSEVV